MICIIDEKNIIANIVNAEKPLAGDEVAFYPWNRLGALYTDVEPLDEAKARYIVKAKAERDAGEVMPITYNGKAYDYDTKARERLLIARTALADSGQATIAWTTADNADVPLSLTDFKSINGLVAQRSNDLHVWYRGVKAKLMAVANIEELEQIYPIK